MFAHVFQLFPIFLAVLAGISCSIRFARDRRKQDRSAMVVAIVCCILLIIAQISWWASYVLDGSLMGTIFANNLWAIFDGLIMICLIMLAHPWRVK